MVFGRFGFQKTSMEAVAKAAGISRPGLYLLFPNKEALYRATMQGVMERAQREMEARFADDTLSFEDKLVEAFDALMGLYVESQVSRDLGTLLANSGPQLGSMFGDYQNKAQTTITAQIKKHAPPGLLTTRGAAKDVMNLLYAAALTWKSTAATRAEFREQVRRATRLICRSQG
ncbi:transcriptional regulator, TetR family [Kibdelosporangium aridum]|uniref:Transcriptional regulator, TetR family n=1 Tax=Kibdelosporangium aridum TaxID=2030 RepID=A0A1Y5Y9D4_KIBAR|nr:transcriptional regulator, TetR family [Kibdelosporangium aridum]